MKFDTSHTFETVQSYLLSKPEVTENFPFGPDTYVYRLKEKVFAILSVNGVRGSGASINLKCDPDQALALRDIFEGVIPGYHMNKKHWNTVHLNSDVPDAEIERLIDHSYSLILSQMYSASKG